MPKPAFAYLKGLLAVVEEATCVSISRVIPEVSHDSLTRMLNSVRLNWQTLLQSLTLSTFGKLSGGYLIIDDTVIEKQFARFIEGLSFVYSSKKKRSVLGYCLVVLTWSDGRITIPLGVRLWKKGAGVSKFDLALELLKYAQETLGIQPKFVVFDAWYASGVILKTLDRWGWTFVTQLKKNRKFQGVPLNHYRRNPYWMEQGTLSGGMQVLVVRNGKRYFVTNDVLLSKEELLRRYRNRWKIEDTFRLLHMKLGIGECQAQSVKAQTAHFHLALMAYLVLERERILSGQTLYQLKRAYSSLKHQQLNFPLLERLCQGA